MKESQDFRRDDSKMFVKSWSGTFDPMWWSWTWSERRVIKWATMSSPSCTCNWYKVHLIVRMLCCPWCSWMAFRLSHTCLTVAASDTWTNCATERLFKMRMRATHSAMSHSLRHSISSGGGASSAPSQCVHTPFSSSIGVI